MADPGAVDGSRGFATELWSMLANGGVWGVPRSGLLFTKRGKTLALTERMPYEEAMPWTPENWREMQQDDIDGIREMFSIIDVLVVDETLFEKA
jgi:hypothetical protein